MILLFSNACEFLNNNVVDVWWKEKLEEVAIYFANSIFGDLWNYSEITLIVFTIGFIIISFVLINSRLSVLTSF